MRVPRVLAFPLCLFLFGAACSGGQKTDEAAKATASPKEQAVKGGTLVIGAEQEPDCLDLIGSCAGASWGYWVGFVNTIPRAFDVVRGKYQPGDVLSGEPDLESSPKQKVTYKINPKAVWSDGTAVTSSDFKYTWTEITTKPQIYSKIGYDKIESVDDTNPKTAVVTFKEAYAPWRDLFGAFYGVLPKHLLDGKNRNKEMADGFKWSAGPFMIESWAKGQSLTLVPNPKWWGKAPNVDKVVFNFITNTSAELQAYKTGQVMAIYPQPQVELTNQLNDLPDTKYTIEAGTTYEGLWLNAKKKPLDSKVVRQALAYAVDRDLIVGQLIKPMKSGATVLQSFNMPNVQGGKYHKASFSKYKQDLTKVQTLMSGDGWAKGADGIWAKGGQKATLEINTTAGNKGRELVEQLLQSQLKQAGFDLKINNTEAGTLFGKWLPNGQHMIGMYAQVGTPDPDLCQILCGDQVPGPENDNAGQNYDFIKSAAMDAPLKAQLKELDDDKRAALVKQAMDAIADEVPAIPLYQKLTTLVWSTKLGGPIEDNTVLGPFYNLSEWWIKA